MTATYLTAVAALGCIFSAVVAETIPPYIHQCSWSDPKVTECFIHGMMHLRPYLANARIKKPRNIFPLSMENRLSNCTGIEEIELPPVEPFRLNELSLSLTTGPNGYRVTLKDIDLYGASNFSVARLKLGEKGAPFEAQIRLPQLRISSTYTSSGVLIIIPASGQGSFHATLGGVTAGLRGSVSSTRKNDKDYLHVDKLNVDLKIKEVNMGIKRAFNNNPILTEATNLFLRSNGHEVLEAMMPQLRQKLSEVFMGISNTLLKHVPVQYLVRD